MNTVAIVLFRQDLRIQDNPALYHALQSHSLVLPLFIYDPILEKSLGSCSKLYLHDSLVSLKNDLLSLGLDLNVLRGSYQDVLTALFSKHPIQHLFWNRLYEPEFIERDKKIKAFVKKQDIAIKSFNASLLFEPWEILKKDLNPYKVFTAFFNQLKSMPLSLDLKITGQYQTKNFSIPSLKISDLNLSVTKKWAKKIMKHWHAGSDHAWEKVYEFEEDTLSKYHISRNLPAIKGTSQISVNLHFGEISVRVLWNQIQNLKLKTDKSISDLGIETFLSELAWREFAYYILYHFPQTTKEEFQAKFQSFNWSNDNQVLKLWQKGLTGFPIVDAGMRELWATGWMHNRVRMIVASFLTKDLMIDWREGANWFLDTLLDADLASNTLAWQWTAGCGVDAAPYFRIFNPRTQSQKFDPDGDYIKKWIPELKNLPKKWIHQPSMTPKDILKMAGITLGKDYPKEILDHSMARKEALAAYKKLSTTR